VRVLYIFLVLVSLQLHEDPAAHHAILPKSTPMWEAVGIATTNTLQCEVCKSKSEPRIEHSTSIWMTLPREPCRLEELLTDYFGTQQYTEHWEGCPNGCQNKGKVTKSISPCTWPPVLVLCLKRWHTFWMDDVMFTEKVFTYVSCPLHLTPPHRSFTASSPYKLRGVAVHHGEEPRAGHYSSFVRCSDDFWYNCDDDRAPRRCSFEDVQASEAYLLFYER